MSGFCALIEPAGRPLRRDILTAMTAILRARGPDSETVWHDGPVGFGHTGLRTSAGEPAPVQLRSLDGRIRLTGDIRLDGGDDLRAELSRAGRPPDPAATPDQLVLNAYRVWGEACVRHLRGDFAFVIWDSEAGRLLGARDHFGLKPFYYAAAGGGLQVSNTLACLLAHPEVAAESDEPAIADYLLFGFTIDPERSAFASIRRLPPAHVLTWSPAAGIRVERFWELPAPPLLHYRRAVEYREHLCEVMRLAVRDRLPGDRAGLLLSGGLDSSFVAVMAREVVSRGDPDCALKACTFIYEHLIPDEAGRYAGEVAAALDLPLNLIPADEDEVLIPPDPGLVQVPPELQGVDRAVPSIVGAMTSFEGFRVGLTGHGGDPALHPAPSHPGAFLRYAAFSGLPVHMLRYRRSYGRWPRLGLRRALRFWLGIRPRGDDLLYPPWLDGEFETRLGLRERWDDIMGETGPRAATPRSEACRYLSLPVWTHLFESLDAGVTGLAAELRHPFFDLRVISFLLALPPVPWCVDKEILRQVLAVRLPGTVVRRPKSPLADIPVLARLGSDSDTGPDRDLGQDPAVLREALSGYVDTSRFMLLLQHPEKLRADEADWITRPVLLARWLRRIRQERG